MSDARVRQLERDLAADPTPAARDALAVARARAGDGPWLPVRHADSRRWERDAIPILFAIDPDYVMAKTRQCARGVSLFHAVMAELEDLERAAFMNPSIGRAWPWVDPVAEARADAAWLNAGFRVGMTAELELVESGPPAGSAIRMIATVEGERARRFGRRAIVLESTPREQDRDRPRLHVGWTSR